MGSEMWQHQGKALFPNIYQESVLLCYKVRLGIVPNSEKPSSIRIAIVPTSGLFASDTVLVEHIPQPTIGV